MLLQQISGYLLWLGAGVDARVLWDGSQPSASRANAIRPVVEIDLSKVNVGATGDGGVDTPYSIEAK